MSRKTFALTDERARRDAEWITKMLKGKPWFSKCDFKVETHGDDYLEVTISRPLEKAEERTLEFFLEYAHKDLFHKVILNEEIKES